MFLDSAGTIKSTAKIRGGVIRWGKVQQGGI